MNERIKELILEAGFPKFDKMYVVSDGEELEKFAELIIQECANHIMNSSDRYRKEYFANMIKEHFGVEE